MKPTAGTDVYLLMARVSARTAQVHTSLGNWELASRLVTQAGEYMKRVQWSIEK